MDDFEGNYKIERMKRLKIYIDVIMIIIIYNSFIDFLK
jgi:hypothetical protein